jgi:hypothetical protein
MVEHVRYFASQVYSAEDQITEEQAAAAGAFVRAHFVGERVDHAEIVAARERLQYVVYYRPQVSADVAQRHRERYGEVPFRVSLAPRADGARTMIEEYVYDRAGALIEREQTALDEQGRPSLQRFFDAEGRLHQTVEFEYATNGELAFVRTRNAAGAIVSEERGS